ncbi:hypothetical protein GCM10022223_33200 [Kineosporia mesophila]|uniref:Uncharacterized protein n=1 Tax=Kineosporia mesophila TaxID=566012 RepID=A0ABP6ZT35_9ACTN
MIHRYLSEDLYERAEGLRATDMYQSGPIGQRPEHFQPVALIEHDATAAAQQMYDENTLGASVVSNS